MLAAGEIDAARQATTELAGIAAVYATWRTGRARSVPRHSRSQRRNLMALPLLRSAAQSWREIDAPRRSGLCPHRPGMSGRRRRGRSRGRARVGAINLRPAAPARSTTGGRAAASPPAVGTSGLSAREIEVLSWSPLAGRTRRSQELFVSERTVHRHVSNIFDKLGVHSRTAAASYAIQHRIVDVGIF
jgi:DNA-binding CsgD family transcriptional regulator